MLRFAVIRHKLDTECLIYEADDPKHVIAHRWSSNIIGNVYKYLDILIKLELYQDKPLMSFGQLSDALAKSGFTLVFTGYDNGWHQIYGGCDAECCRIYTGRMMKSAASKQALQEMRYGENI